MKIVYKKRDEIDSVKWDKCIAQSVNGIVYAYSWYLDITTKKWDALVGGDYQAVFPIIFDTKYFLDYIYQPIFCQQLGLFSTKPFDQSIVAEFIDYIPKKYRFISINFNSYIKVDYSNAKILPKVTYQLDLKESYKNIANNYKTNTRRNLTKARTFNLNVSKGINAFHFLELLTSDSSFWTYRKHSNTLKDLIIHSLSNGHGEIYGAYNNNNELCAGAFFLRSNKKLIYLLPLSNAEAKRNRAMFAIIDQCINDNSGSQFILDFEGSNVESIARFFSGFGAEPCEYFNITINRLPWFLKIFK